MAETVEARGVLHVGAKAGDRAFDMKTVYELINHGVQYGKPGGTRDDFDVFRGNEVLGQFEPREAAEQEVQPLQNKTEDRLLAIHIEEEFDEYEIRAVEIPGS